MPYITQHDILEPIQHILSKPTPFTLIPCSRIHTYHLSSFLYSDTNRNKLSSQVPEANEYCKTIQNTRYILTSLPFDNVHISVHIHDNQSPISTIKHIKNGLIHSDKVHILCIDDGSTRVLAHDQPVVEHLFFARADIEVSVNP